MASDPFVTYYERKSTAPESVAHFVRLRDLLLRVLSCARSPDSIHVADIGCNAGTFSRVWADAGCRVSGIDINASLISTARTRATEDGYTIDFQTGSADSLPWSDSTFDVVVMPELLEHVANWQECLSEAARVLRPGGVLYVSTTNRLCPVQEEFTLPAYSWYPGWLKRRCVKRSLTTHRNWVNFAAYPAVTWFDPYWLGDEFRKRGLAPLDRFALFAAHADSSAKRIIGQIAIRFPPARFLGHVLTSGTRMLGRKP
jgi:2-polyprenyl-6-hydroxyphenyl methylase/3-demethylubiquinone-9 3-methyltransferase